MALGYDRLFGFNTTQKDTLEKYIAEQVAAAVTAAVARATTTVAGTNLQAAARANITPATDGTAVGTAFNDLLTKLRTAGILAP